MHPSLNFKLASLLPFFLSILNLPTPASSSPLAQDLESRHHRQSINEVAPSSHFRTIDQAVPDSYLVVLKKDVSRAVFRRHLNNYSFSGKGFNIGSYHAYEGVFPNEEDLVALELSPEVDYIEPNRYVRTAIAPSYGPLLNASTPSWGLHRISHREQAPHSGPYSYIYHPPQGNCSTDAYIIDTGIYLSHSDFEGRASFGYNTIGGPNEDGTGHGTHVTGLVIGKTFGVVKNGRAISVKALDDEGFGTYASVIAGMDWVCKEARARKMIGKSVMNLSLVGLKSKALNDAVEAAYVCGIPVVVAAGNYEALAVDYSPASAQNALTIGAIDIHDTKPLWSNYGIVLDHFAPGVELRSTFIAGPNSTAILSGTSMAAPHVAGLVNYLQCNEGLTIPRMIRERLEKLAIKKEVINGGNTSPDRIVFNGAGEY